MSGRDPIELLRELASAQRAASESTVDADQLLADLGERRVGRLRAWLRRRRRWVAGIIVVLVGTGGATVAWAIVHRERATSPTMIHCHVDPTVDGSRFVIQADGSDPVAQCIARWPTDVPELGPVQSALIACRGTLGEPAVFPGTAQTCQELGLPLLDPTLSDQDQALIAFQDQLSETVLALGCVPPDEVADLAAQTAREVGLEGWTITVEKPTPEQPCGRFGVDPVTRVIYIQLLPDLFGGDEEG